MTPAAITAVQPTGIPTRAISHVALWLVVFMGGFVFVEPSPYELMLVLLMPVWLVVGFSVPRALSPLIVLMTLFLAGGVLAATQAEDFSRQPLYHAVTAFLAFSACFFACLVAEDTRRVHTIISGWIAAAIATTALGVAGYFGLTGELFTKFGRASGGFQDPNVFGPFLVFPFLVLTRRVLTRPFGPAFFSALLALALLFGIFLSFSRAAWGLTLITLAMLGFLLFVTGRNATARIRFVVLATAGLAACAALIAVALSIPTVAELFQIRAQIVQEHDYGPTGRFARYAAGFNLMLDHPLGLGAFEFARLFGEDEHNIWLKALTTYGWLGFAAFVALVIWTLAAAFPLMFRTGPLRDATQIAYILLIGQIVMATVIDIDHWRHIYLLFGLLWGAIAADRAATQARLSAYIGAHPSAALRH